MLLKDIHELADEPVVIAPDDQDAEFANTHWLSATMQERSLLSVAQVASAFLDTGRALQRHLATTGRAGTATFYVWHDQQAGQLRCSVSSRTPSDLPFSGRYHPTEDLAAIVAGFLSDQTPGAIVWTDLEPIEDCEFEDDDSCSYPSFPVWTLDLGLGS